MENDRRYSRQRVAGREHIPLYPKGFIALTIVQLVLAVIVTGLCAFGIAVAPISGNCFMIFVSLSTMVVTVWLIVAEFSSPKAYNYWAVLALDIFLLFFWLCSFALLAAQTVYLFDGSYYDYYGRYYIADISDIGVIFPSCMAAAAGIGGLEFALFITSLSIHGVMLHRHRKAGLHCNPVGFYTAAAPVVANNAVPEKDGVQVATTFKPGPDQAHAQNAPPYVQHDVNYISQVAPRHQQQQQFQQQQVSPPQPTFTPPPAQQPQQQNHYPQASPTPLSATHTGGSFPQTQPELSAAPPMPKVHEAPGNAYHAQ
ncbi:hypothetical protein CGRA01v4_02715 [Colletotrichum graminicola]|uniref:MARVEL domain-containing protein n=1 Tax=Colletotrichum graminicola (strain M1.001 / M2 / FGSC 10212) TaxID=645133 RepID=E3Q417_COLGM|nr:uncharacterized protein GLRG_00473 [Colletotrichum graminicola M1.001]EFQ25329.1 hypothetical protein GLRG_00473 [Colletotrichum graminicola M1.001]WDK11436.1 hypothetical protein CGRA01v4_02715 [Colletotrichum graminicola]